MNSSIQPTSVYLPDEIKHSLKLLVQRTGKPEAELIQEAIKVYLERQNRLSPRSIGIGVSNQGDLSERVDELLWQDP